MKDQEPINIGEYRARRRLNRAKGITGTSPVSLWGTFMETAYNQKKQRQNPKENPEPNPEPPKVS